MTRYAASLDDVRAAARRIAPHAHRTPVATCATLDRLAGRALLLKCEHLQKVGAFKFRGALNAVLRLSEADAARGVATHSSGNHAQALALAACQRGCPATVVMPANAPEVKRRATEGYGAQVVACEPTLAAREAAVEEVVERTGAVLIHPFDHPDVIAGQGSVALELLEQAAPLDAIVVPVSGGGLAAGVCLAARGLAPDIRLFAAEPSGADDAARSFAAGRRLPQTDPRTVADGLLAGLGELTWPVLRDHLEDVLLVDDDAIVAAMRLAWERAKLPIEPSAAAALAAVLDPAFCARPGMARVGVVLSGGNVDAERVGALFAAASGG